ncbi:hypothetical protein O6H91_15G033500 [Diphasiastrum complanatum]|uniref:Uncharacterized protein n=1 Tax=Diphasiastrum complanatum TaxID=34168 RepID=A0ACC2BH36_DIPCM|nr:hypothetical protein O6H91_15G033500 [Diphasiastrum complanatum]
MHQKEREIQRNELLSQAWGLFLSLVIMLTFTMKSFWKDKVASDQLTASMLQSSQQDLQDKYIISHRRAILMEKMTVALMIAFGIAWSAGKKHWKMLTLAEISFIDRERVGVIIGSGMGGLTVFSDGVQALIEKGCKKITPFFIPYAITNMGSALLAIDLGLMGPNYSISTACATSNYCFYAAANHIRRGEADVMVVGGTEAPIIPVGVGGFVACRALSQRNDDPQTASRPWDRAREGFVMGEGAGVLVMESLEHAMKRGAPIIAEYLGGAVTCDAYHMTDPRSDGLGVSTCIEKSLQDAGVSKEEVNYINAHATSTVVGDLAEVNAVKKVFKDTSEIKMNATKSMIGHCLGSAGGLEAIATIKAITTGWLHPTINQFDPEPAVTFDTVPNVKKQHEVHVGISNSFGFGGHNSVVVFAPFRP